MRLKTTKLNLIVVAFFVINILAIPALSTNGMAAGAEAGAAAAGAAGGTATAAGITTGTIAAGAAIAAAAALVIATSGGESRAVPTPTALAVNDLANTNPAAATTVAASLQQLESNDTALLGTATTALGTTGQTAMAQAANTLSTTEFQNLASLTTALNQSEASGLAAASTSAVLGSSQGGIAPTDAFSTGLSTADFSAVVSAMNTDGVQPLAARDNLTPAQQKMYDYMAGLRSAALKNSSLKAGFNGLYNAVNKVKSDSTAVNALTNLVNGVGSSNTTNKLNTINTLLTQITSSGSKYSATQNLFKATDSDEVKAVQDIFKASIKDGEVDTSSLKGITNVVVEAGTGTPAEVAQKSAEALRLLLTIQHKGFTVTVTVSHLGNNIYSTVAHIKK